MSEVQRKLELDYAPAVPLHRRRMFRVAIVLLVLVSAIVAAVWKGKPYAQQARYLWWQSRCMRFVAPADIVAYEEDPTRAAALAKQSGYQLVNPPPPAGKPSAVGFVPPPLNKLAGNWVCMLFVHARTSPAGNERLAVLGYQVYPSPGGARTVDIYGSGKTLATLTPGSQLAGSAGSRMCLRLAPRDRLRMFWGQVDPKQADHFTIGYLLNDQPGMIDAWLRDDGRIELKVRDGPATRIWIGSEP